MIDQITDQQLTNPETRDPKLWFPQPVVHIDSLFGFIPGIGLHCIVCQMLLSAAQRRARCDIAKVAAYRNCQQLGWLVG